jgi:hypothetical protein
VQVNRVRAMSAEQAIAVARLIEQRQMIEAVMALRAICNIGLAEARDVINQFPARGFPAELLPAGGVSLRPTAAAPAAPDAPPPMDDEFDPEASSQEGEEDESNDARHSLAGVRAAVDEVRAEVQTVIGQALRAAGVERPSSAPSAVHVSSVPVAQVASAHAPRIAATAPAVPAASAPVTLRRNERGVMAESVAGLLRTRQGARQAILMSEILGAPRAFKPHR